MYTYSGLFYGGHRSTLSTLKKALLLYDEVHFIDRPSFFIETSSGQFGTIGIMSPFREIPSMLQRDDIKIICHEPLNGDISNALKASLEEDLADRNFIKTFTDSFFGHNYFSDLFIQPNSKYTTPNGKDYLGKEIKFALSKVDWSNINFSIEDSSKINAPPFDVESKESLKLTMLMSLVEASYLLNTNMITTIDINAVPFTDIAPYHSLLIAKYKRAKESEIVDITKSTKINFIAHTIFDEIIDSESFKNKDLLDILKYRERHQEELINFRQYLAKIQHQIENEVYTKAFELELQKLIDLELMPKVKEYKENLIRSWEDLFGPIIKGALTLAAITGIGTITASILAGMPLDKLVTIGNTGAIAAWLGTPVVDFFTERRRIPRNNGLAYLLKV